MAEVVVQKGADGKLEGVGEKGARAWARFRRAVENMPPGATLSFAWFPPRSPEHHRRFFAWLHALHDCQEVFPDAEKLRAWLTVGAGECDFVPGPNGMLAAIPRSIKWHKLDESEFADLVHAIKGFIWGPHARSHLWPTLPDARRYETLEALDREFW